MMRRFAAGLLTATLTAALLVFGSGSPAQAQTTAGCGILPHNFQLQVIHEPRMFHYYLQADRNKNNVNIRIYSATDQLLWSWNSPDDRRGGQWYHIQPSTAVPQGGYATFTGIFDVSFSSDPRCTYTTQICCLTWSNWAPNGLASGPWGVSPPYLTGLDNLQVQADLPGHSSFEYRVKAPGMPTAYFPDQGALFTLDRSVYGGKTVEVSSRAEGSGSNPWTYPAVRLDVPALPTPPPPKHPCDDGRPTCPAPIPDPIEP